jgi:hypothetical protein
MKCFCEPSSGSGSGSSSRYPGRVSLVGNSEMEESNTLVGELAASGSSSSRYPGELSTVYF